jgi:puromycin-sensitive aminopeptidase
MASDGLASSHPVEVEVRDAGMINEIFDAISYYKGSSVIRQIASFVGPAAFQQGLRTYLQEKQYACATTEDLWRHITAASGKPVAAIMEQWSR